MMMATAERVYADPDSTDCVIKCVVPALIECSSLLPIDWLLFGTALAAESAGLPSVALIHCPYPLRRGGDVLLDPGAPARLPASAWAARRHHGLLGSAARFSGGG